MGWLLPRRGINCCAEKAAESGSERRSDCAQTPSEIVVAKDASYILSSHQCIHLRRIGARCVAAWARNSTPRRDHRRDQSTNEIVTIVRHLEPNATSRQTVRSVLAASRSALSRQGRVARGADGTPTPIIGQGHVLDPGATANCKHRAGDLRRRCAMCARRHRRRTRRAANVLRGRARLPPAQAKAFFSKAHRRPLDALARTATSHSPRATRCTRSRHERPSRINSTLESAPIPSIATLISRTAPRPARSAAGGDRRDHPKRTRRITRTVHRGVYERSRR